MAKSLKAFVHVYDEQHPAVLVGPDDELEPWMVKALEGNPGVFEDAPQVPLPQSPGNSGYVNVEGDVSADVDPEPPAVDVETPTVVEPADEPAAERRAPGRPRRS